MKCDELNAHHISTRSGNSCHCYFKSDVDAAIDELKQKLEDAKATACTESVDAGMRERRLIRALWLARADRAEARKKLLVRKKHPRRRQQVMVNRRVGCKIHRVH